MKTGKHSSDKKDNILTISEALEIIKENIPDILSEVVSLEESIGKYLAKDILAPEPSPRYTNSAMDGYALQWQDVLNATPDSPAVLQLVGESQAGMQFKGSVSPGQAIRISTGAVLAPGCDTVVKVEDTMEENGLVHIYKVRSPGQDVRRKGEEFTSGETLLSRGLRLTAARTALLAGVGIETVAICKPCNVAILVTGSELVSVGEKIADDQIRDSNMIMLKAAVQEAGGHVIRCIRIEDEAEATYQAIAATDADIILCTGGVSVGRHDHVKNAATENGYTPLFWRIRQKPGKPLYFARKGKTLLFGLPGNPVSAFMCYNHYVRPLITALNGLSFGWPMVPGELLDDISNNGKRPNMIRVELKWRPNRGHSITHAAKQGSHMLTSLAHADGYIILEPGQTVKKGDRIDVYRYDFLREPVRE